MKRTSQYTLGDAIYRRITGIKPRRAGPRRPRAYKRGPNLQQERKFFDTAVTDAVISSSGTVQTSPNLVAQGTAEDERIGRKIIVRSIAARFQIQLPSGTNQADLTGGDTTRIIIFIDKQCNGVATAVLDLLETAVFDSFRNLSNQNRFVILSDRFFTFNRLVAMTDGTNTASTPTVIKDWRFYKKLNLPIEFDSTSGAITGIQSNCIQYLYISAFGICGLTNQETRIRFDG